MRSQVSKWGNSLGVRIPRHLAEKIQIADGTVVNIEVEGENLVVRPAKRRKYNLEELLEQITPENLHEEIDTGEPVGNEIW